MEPLNLELIIPEEEQSSKFEINLPIQECEGLSTPIRKTNLLGFDLSDSKLLNIPSPLLTEEMLMNENIDFLMNTSNNENSPVNSKSVSFNYSKSEPSVNSSVFQSFERMNLLVNSVLHSNTEHFILCRKSVEPKFFAERTDIKVPSLKIPMRLSEKLVKIRENFVNVEDQPIVNEMPIDCDQSNDNSFKKSDVCDADSNVPTGRNIEMNIESKCVICSCVPCNIY